MIDLHLHTTVSDGRLTPYELVERAAAAGVRVMAVTDHDTTLATSDVRTFAAVHGIEAISGIEVTAIEEGRDVHILGYFVRDSDASFNTFLKHQRGLRLQRVRAIAHRLTELGMPVDVEPILVAGHVDAGRTIGRPELARAMVRAGHSPTVSHAFDRWLGHGRPAFVPREGPSCESVIDAIHAAGGLASMAHPGRVSMDQRIPALCAAGLDAIEVHHSDHDAQLVSHYSSLAQSLGALVTGGSDFHGDPHQEREPGCRTLPEDDWVRLVAAAGRHA